MSRPASKRRLAGLAFAALAAVALAGTARAQAPALGTFFHTPEERERLDRLRRGDPVAARAAVPGQARPTGTAITGFVQRSDGKNTLWIDGRPIPTSNPRAAPLFDPRKVTDDGRPLPELNENPARSEK